METIKSIMTKGSHLWPNITYIGKPCWVSRDKKTANDWSVRPRRATIEMALVTIWWPSMTIKQSAINDNQAIRQHQKSPVVMNHLPEAAPSGGLTGTLLESCYTTTLHCTALHFNSMCCYTDCTHYSAVHCYSTLTTVHNTKVKKSAPQWSKILPASVLCCSAGQSWVCPPLIQQTIQLPRPHRKRKLDVTRPATALRKNCNKQTMVA